MTEQFAINLLELQFISISNPLKKRWLRLHIKEFKRQKLQVETKQQSDFQIANYLEIEIKKIKCFLFQRKLWLEICLKLFQELENISTTNYAAVYLICLQVHMSSNSRKKKNIQHYLKFLQKYTRNDNPVSLEKTISNIKQELETVRFDDRTTTFEIDWANECKIFLENL